MQIDKIARELTPAGNFLAPAALGTQIIFQDSQFFLGRVIAPTNFNCFQPLLLLGQSIHQHIIACSSTISSLARTSTMIMMESSSISRTRTDNRWNRSGVSFDATRHVFHTKLSVGLTVASLVLLSGLSMLYGGDVASRTAQPSLTLYSPRYGARFLNDNNNLNGDDDAAGNNNNNDDAYASDYSTYSCNSLYSIVPDRGAEQCAFARTCNAGRGVWSPWVFCSSQSLHFTCGILAPVMLVWLVILFRMLGSTAEDYFSPALEMLANKLGLPPRFAGVSLLALGNGAADVSATVSAITNDPEHGYLLSLGALTGAAMVISTVVSALVVLVAGGVPCRGALVRDVAALGLSVLLVWRALGGTNGDEGGVVDGETISLFLSLYAIFVLLVLMADIYHRAVVLPRRELQAQEAERQRQLRVQELHEQEIRELQQGDDDDHVLASNTDNDSHSNNYDAGCDPGCDAPGLSSHPVRFSTVLTAFSNYDNDNDQGQGWGAGGGVESEELAHDRPIMLHGSHGILHQGQQYHHPESAQDDQQTHPSGLESSSSALDPESSYSIMLDSAGNTMDQICVEQGVPGGSADTSWLHALRSARYEVHQHAAQVWEDIAYNADVDPLTKIMLILELPFVILRKITVSIPCEGFYVRGLVALSLAISPIWMNFYLWYSAMKRAGNMWKSPVFWIYLGLCWMAALIFVRYAPRGDGENISLWVSTPVALYGFVIAATWIDIVADALVQLLDFIGIVLRIPGPIVGLTILAWGNSMADLSADVTMARKGLANMAMTACFAGPFFNILVGLGLGFSQLASKSGVSEREVHLEPSISAGFWYLAANSVIMLITGMLLGKGKIPKKYGYIAVSRLYDTVE